jgi:hypothetical protein
MTARPELIKQRRNAFGDGKTLGEQGYMSFPTKPMPHGLLMQFKDYNYNAYVNTIRTEVGGKERVESASAKDVKFNEGGYTFVNKLNAAPEIDSANAIELPFPRQLTDSLNIRVNQFERDFLYERVASGLASLNGDGNFTENAAAVAKDFLEGVRTIGRDLIDNPLALAEKLKAQSTGLMKMAGQDANKAAAIAAYLGRNFISGELAKSMGVIGERTVNPQETLNFSGVDLRNFNFSWDLYPSNEDDTKNITKIVNFLKAKSLPQVDGVDGVAGLQRAFLKYPSVVELNLLGVQEKHFMRFKRAMISNVTVDYGAGGMPEIIKGGVPAAVSLSISFSEIQIHTQDDYAIYDKDNKMIGLK